MYLRASEMSKQAWSEAVKTNNLEEHMLLDPLYYSFGQKCWGGASKCWGGAKHVGGCTNEVGGGCAPPPHPPRKSASDFLKDPGKVIELRFQIIFWGRI